MTVQEFGKQTETSQNFSGKVLYGEPLRRYTTMITGGPAEVYIEPSTEESLVFVLNQAVSSGLKFFVLGGGSNTVINDAGLELVISTRAVRGVELCPDKKSVSVLAGTYWGSVIAFCKEHNLGGFEGFTGLSGTTGGALFMNATCFGLSACDRLVCVKYFDFADKKVKVYEKNPFDWAYKKSPFQPENGKTSDKIILSATFTVSEGFDKSKSLEVMEKRKAMGHFNAPSAGSAFKNKPEEGLIAGKIIDECGLKGLIYGGAQIAPWHGNFIINPEKNATADDIKSLVEKVQKTVLEKKGILLEPEIIIV